MAYQKHNFKDGDILKAEHLNCIEDCIAEEPNWNAAEGEPGHVLNRTHWVEGGMTEILPSYTIASEEDMYGIPSLNLVVGNTYVVKIAGFGEWTCVAFSANIDGIQVVAIGNREEEGGAGTGEPFVLVEFPPEVAAEMGVNVMLQPLIDAIPMPVTFSISCSQEKVHKLDSKFLDLDWTPKYTEIPLVPECTLEVGNAVNVGVDVTIVNDATYVVYFDGVRYVTKGVFNQDVSGFGNYSYTTGVELENLPFFILKYGAGLLLYATIGSTHTVAIYSVSPPKMPFDMAPEEFSPFVLYTDGEYIYTDPEHTARIRGEVFENTMRSRRVTIKGTSYPIYVPIYSNRVMDNGATLVYVTVVWSGGDAPTFKQLKTGAI